MEKQQLITIVSYNNDVRVGDIRAKLKSQFNAHTISVNKPIKESMSRFVRKIVPSTEWHRVVFLDLDAEIEKLVEQHPSTTTNESIAQIIATPLTDKSLVGSNVYMLTAQQTHVTKIYKVIEALKEALAAKAFPTSFISVGI